MLSHRCLAHLLGAQAARADADAATAANGPLDAATADTAADALGALRCAERALHIQMGGAGDFLKATDATALTNLAIARVLCERESAEQEQPDAPAAAATAKPLLERAVSLSTVPEERGRASVALAGTHEALGDVQSAAEVMRSLLRSMPPPPPASGLAAVVAQGETYQAAGDHAGALACFKDALRLATAARQPERGVSGAA